MQDNKEHLRVMISQIFDETPQQVPGQVKIEGITLKYLTQRKCHGPTSI